MPKVTPNSNVVSSNSNVVVAVAAGAATVVAVGFVWRRLKNRKAKKDA
jgi:hypothetical protein